MKKKDLGLYFGIAAGLAGTALAAYKVLSDNKKNSNYSSKKKRNMLVTGASTGIGKAIAEVAANNSYTVYATVRKEKDAKTLEEISANIIPVIMDVTDHDSIIKAKEIIKEKLNGEKIHGLVNNAGIAVAGPIELLSLDELRKQFEVNVFGLVDTTQIFMDLLIPHESKIIMISSVAGRVTQPFIGAYSSSKHALEAISDALRRELLPTGIDVVVVQPGNIVTPIWEKADEIDVEPYKGSRYYETMENVKKVAVKRGMSGEKAEKVGEVVLDILRRRKNKTRYTVSKRKVLEVYMGRVLPDRTLDKLVAKVLKMK